MGVFIISKTYWTLVCGLEIQLVKTGVSYGNKQKILQQPYISIKVWSFFFSPRLSLNS